MNEKYRSYRGEVWPIAALHGVGPHSYPQEHNELDAIPFVILTQQQQEDVDLGPWR